MIELTANQIADLLRKCSGTKVCEGCPFHPEHPRCARKLMQSAAVMIDQQAHALAQLRRGTGNK